MCVSVCMRTRSKMRARAGMAVAKRFHQTVHTQASSVGVGRQRLQGRGARRRRPALLTHSAARADLHPQGSSASTHPRPAPAPLSS